MPPEAQKVFQGKIFSVWQWEQELYDGSKATFERIARPDYAYAVGVLDDGNILLLHDEQPDREAVLTPAGGKVDEGETPQQAVHREFSEETGLRIGQLTPWHAYQPSTKVEMTTYAFVARKLVREQEPHPEPGEKIREVTFTFEEFLQLGHEPQLRDWMLRILLLQALLDKNKEKELRRLFYE